MIRPPPRSTLFPSPPLFRSPPPPGDAPPADMGQRDLKGRDALADPDIEMVQGAGLDPDQDLARVQLGLRSVFIPEHLWPAVLVKARRLHPVRTSRTLRSP